MHLKTIGIFVKYFANNNVKRTSVKCCCSNGIHHWR